jgi:uncharacterized membrane protein YqhA
VPDAPTPAPSAATAAASRLIVWLLRGLRLVLFVGIVSLLVAAMLLLGYCVVQTYQAVVTVLTPDASMPTSRDLILGGVKLVDLVLLATVLQIVAVGLYALFIDARVPTPSWLKIESIADLKRELATVVIVVLAVVFLEEVVTWGSERDLLRLGVGVGAVIAALSFFLRIRSDKPKD